MDTEDLLLKDLFLKSKEVFRFYMKEVLFISVIIFLSKFLIELVIDVDRSNMVLFLVKTVLIRVFTIYSYMMISYMVKESMDQKKASFNDALSNAFTKSAELFRTYGIIGILGVLVVYSRLSLLILFFVLFIFVEPIIVLKDMDGIKALKYSGIIVKENFIACIRVFILFGLISAPIQYLTIYMKMPIVYDLFLPVMECFKFIVMSVLFINIDENHKDYLMEYM